MAVTIGEYDLVFDMLVGYSIATDALTVGIPKLIVAPLLLCTLMFGPMGYLLYCVVRLLFPLVQ